MNILELAKECGAAPLFCKTHEEWALTGNKKIEKFAHAVIEDYKAELVPVAWIVLDMHGDKYLSFEQPNGYYEERPLYALPSGETK